MPKQITYTTEQNTELLKAIAGKLHNNDLTEWADAFSGIESKRDARDLANIIREVVAEEDEARRASKRAAKG